MLSYNINSFEAANRLTKMCDKYKDVVAIDVIYGRYTVDGSSILGVHSLSGHIVSIDPQTTDKNILKQIEDDLQKITEENEK